MNLMGNRHCTVFLIKTLGFFLIVEGVSPCQQIEKQQLLDWAIVGARAKRSRTMFRELNHSVGSPLRAPERYIDIKNGAGKFFKHLFSFLIKTCCGSVS